MNVYTSKFLSIAACSLIGCAVVCSAQGETNFAPLVTGIRTDFEYQPKGAPAPVPELRLQSDLVVTAEGNLDDWADKVAKLKTNVTKEQIIAKLVPYIDGMALMGTYHVSAPREPGSDREPSSIASLALPKTRTLGPRCSKGRDSLAHTAKSALRLAQRPAKFFPVCLIKKRAANGCS